jgi:group I intron endonuclease
MIGVYKITNPKGAIYIGSSINIEQRLKHYVGVSCKGQRKLYNSIRKYGWENHFVEIMIECELEDLYHNERYFGEYYNVLGENGLNLILPKNGEIKVGVSSETRRRMSESSIGEKGSFYGKTHTKETREKISKAQLGRKHTLEHRLKVSLNNSRYKSKVVLNLNDGMFYDSCLEASIAYGFKYSTLRSQLNGTNKNSSSMIFV